MKLELDAVLDHELRPISSLHSGQLSNAVYCIVGMTFQIHVMERPATKEKLFMPIYAQIPLVVVLVVLSGLFSGLNIGLISLDTTELELIIKTGSDSERIYAARILPVRRKGNYLLCSILVGNTLVNTVITLLTDNLIESLLPDSFGTAVRTVISTVLPTMSIVIFGEVIPQSICTKSVSQSVRDTNVF